MTTLADIDKMDEILDGLREIKRSVELNGKNKYGSPVLRAINEAILRAEFQRDWLATGFIEITE